MYGKRRRSGRLTVSKDIGAYPRPTWGSSCLRLFAITANRTRAVISPNQAPQALARRQPHSLGGAPGVVEPHFVEGCGVEMDG
jgi:hypothetical protein